MKRILSLVLCAVMLTSVLVFDTFAAGTLVFNDDFSVGFAPRNWFADESCAFSWDEINQCIHGYSDALVLQSRFSAPYNKMWDDFYVTFDVQVRADDDNPDAETTSVGMWYRDLFENEDGMQGAVYMFSICVQTGEATLKKDQTVKYVDDNGFHQEHVISEVIAGPVTIEEPIQVGEDAEWFNMGMRVTDGVMQCYYNETLIFDLKADPNDEKVNGVALHNIDDTVGTQKSAILFWNIANWVALDNFEVWTADYDFNDTILYGDVDGNGTVNLLDASAIMKYAAGWTSVALVEQVADVDGSGAVNLNDVSLVMKHAAKWDVVLGPTETE